MQVREFNPEVEYIFTELHEAMSAAHALAVTRLAAVGVIVRGRVGDELEAEAEDLREWVDRVRAAVVIAGPRKADPVAPNHYTPENPPDRP